MMRAPCTVHGPIPGMAVSSAMSSSSGRRLSTSGSRRPSDSRPVADEPRQHRVGAAQVGTRFLQPHYTAGILAHRARSLPSAGMPVIIVMFGSDDGDLR